MLTSRILAASASTILAIVSISSLTAADKKPALSTWTVKTKVQKERTCPAQGGVYLGPNQPWHHWGTCVRISSGAKIQTKYTRTRNKCNGNNWVYVGPNRAVTHGGYCARIKGNKWALESRQVKKKACKSDEVYAGVNNTKAHWGHCIKVVKKTEQLTRQESDLAAFCNSEIGEHQKRDELHELPKQCHKIAKRRGLKIEKPKPVFQFPKAATNLAVLAFQSPSPGSKCIGSWVYLVNKTTDELRVYYKVKLPKWREAVSRRKDLDPQERKYIGCRSSYNGAFFRITGAKRR